MSRFQILDSKRYPLHVDNENKRLNFYQYEHRATIGQNCREYMVFIDHVGRGFGGPTSHIEEITGGHLERIEDEILAEALQVFARENGFLNVGAPILRTLG